MDVEVVQAISNLHLQMIKPAVVLRINLRVKNARPVSVAVTLERDVKNKKYKYRKKVARYISSLKHRIKFYTRCRKNKIIQFFTALTR